MELSVYVASERPNLKIILMTIPDLLPLSSNSIMPMYIFYNITLIAKYFCRRSYPIAIFL